MVYCSREEIVILWTTFDFLSETLEYLLYVLCNCPEPKMLGCEELEGNVVQYILMPQFINATIFFVTDVH